MSRTDEIFLGLVIFCFVMIFLGKAKPVRVAKSAVGCAPLLGLLVIVSIAALGWDEYLKYEKYLHPVTPVAHETTVRYRFLAFGWPLAVVIVFLVIGGTVAIVINRRHH